MKYLAHPLSVSPIKTLFSVILTTLGLSSALSGAEVTLAWDPSPDAGVGGYRLHYGTGSGEYSSSTNAGMSTTLTVIGLQEGITYFFAATAVGTNQLESEFSNEISYTVPLPSNQPPSITVINNQIIAEDGVAGPIAFTVNDPETASDSLTLAASSSNPALVPNANIVFGGSAANRTITVTPLANAFGSAQILVAVSDGELSATRQFTVTVNSINDLPTITSIGDQIIEEDAVAGPISFTVGDVETSLSSLTVSGFSDNPTLVPSGNIQIAGSGSARTVSVVPVADKSGTAQITISVSDGTDNVTATFVLTVNPVNDAPTIATIGNQTIDEDTVAGPINFTIGDKESSASSLILAGSSSNPTLVPDSNIIFNGSGTTRSVTVTPAANAFGSTEITVTLSDGELTSTRTFTVTVKSVEDPPAPPVNLRLALSGIE